MDENHNPVGTNVFIQDFTTGVGDNPGHAFGHFMVAEKPKSVSGSLLFQTCPHVFKTPSTVFSIVYVYFDPLSHQRTFWRLGEVWAINEEMCRESV